MELLVITSVNITIRYLSKTFLILNYYLMKTNLNRKGFCLLFSLFLLAGGGGLYASDYHSMSQVQDNVISVSGTVKDTKGEPLIGVSVLVRVLPTVL